MYVPFISTNQAAVERLSRRKGGGGGGKGGGGRGSTSGGKASGGKTSTGKTSTGTTTSGSSSSSSSKNKIKFGSSSKSFGSSSRGGVPAVIPAGELFAGRIAGGGTRNNIFGSRTFGSGYPGVSGRGVAGRGFPFYFWPLAWPVAAGGAAGLGVAAYLYAADEYGQPSNDSRPGGAMAIATFPSASSSTVFRLVSDNSTVGALIDDISANCTSYLGASRSVTPAAFDVNTTKPEQVVQYYRASSIALLLDGYNNTAVFSAEGTPDTPLPAGVDGPLMDCLNQTIGIAAPLLDGSGPRWQNPTTSMGVTGTLYLVWCLSSYF